MNEFLKMDIFFFIATAETLILTALIGLVIWRLLRILKHIERIAEIAGAEAAHLQGDAAYLRGRMLGALDAIFSFIPRRRKKREKNASSTE